MFNLDNHLDREIQRSSAKEKRDRHDTDTELVLEGELEGRINEHDFEGVSAGRISYTKEEIEKDILFKDRLKENFQKNLEHLDSKTAEHIIEGKKRADALEIVIADVGELYNWAGEGAYFIRSSEYDDIVNGVDIIIEFEGVKKDNKEPQRIALAIDASMAKELKHFEKKLDRNVHKITRNSHSANSKEPKVKYFKSNVSDYKGPLPFVIPVVVGLEAKNANELISLYASTKKLKKLAAKSEIAKEQLRDIHERLEFHPSQGIFYKEIMAQLRYYQTILPSSSSDNKEHIANEIETVISQLENISSQKERIVMGKYGEDESLLKILDFCKNEKRP